jgi:hypothetical protein
MFHTRALKKLFTILNGHQKGALGKIKGLFRQPEAAERLEKCKQEFGRMVELFKVCCTNLFQYILKSLAFIAGSCHRFNHVSNVADEKDAKEQHEQLFALLETDSDFITSDRSSVSRHYDDQDF